MVMSSFVLVIFLLRRCREINGGESLDQNGDICTTREKKRCQTRGAISEQELFRNSEIISTGQTDTQD